MSMPTTSTEEPPRRAVSFRLAWALGRLWQISGLAFACPAWSRPLRRIGFMAMALANIGRICRWLGCADNPGLAKEMREFPRIFRIIDRSYIHKDWSLDQRLTAVAQHYRALEASGAVLDIGANQYFDLATLGPEYMDLRIVVDRPRWARAEGELAVSLFCREHRIYSAMLLLLGTPGSRRLVIGAFQGRGASDAKATYVQLTRALHGLRPRDLLVNVLKLIARELGCVEIWGISDACHRGGGAYFGRCKHTSYDEIWTEHGGCLNAEGFFAISPTVRRRDLQDLPSRKRAQYRRRYRLLDDIGKRIHDVFISGERTVKEHACAWTACRQDG